MHFEGGAPLVGERDHLLHALQRVVGVDQKNGIGIDAREGAKRLHFVVEGLHETVRHRAGDGDIVEPPGEHVRRGFGAADEGRPRSLDRGIETLRAAAAEIDHRPPRGGFDDARRLRCDQRLEADLVQRQRLDQLRLADWRDDLNERLVREAGRALRKRMDFATEAEALEPVEEIVGKALLAEIGDVLGGETERLDLVEKIFNPAGDQEIPPLWQAADEEAEDSRPIELERAIGAQHGELVEVGEEPETPRPSGKPGDSPFGSACHRFSGVARRRRCARSRNNARRSLRSARASRHRAVPSSQPDAGPTRIRSRAPGRELSLRRRQGRRRPR